MKTINSPTVRTRALVPVLGGIAEFVTFHGLCDGKEHLAICFGDYSNQSTPLVRLHSECLTGDIFDSERCDCGDQLQEALGKLKSSGGILLYLRQEGRGIGLYNKLDSYQLQAQGLDTYAANQALGFDDDCRDYSVAAQMLFALGVKTIDLLTNNPDKAQQLRFNGIVVRKRLTTGVFAKEGNHNYLKAKATKTSHAIDLRKFS